MLMPSIFRNDVFDNFFEDPFGSYGATDLMSTDIQDKDGAYEITMNIPGAKKEDVQAELKDGYLTIHASVNAKRDDKDEKGHYIRRERYSGTGSRSFFVGDDVTEEDIKAKFEDGTLKMIIPKKEAKPAVETKRFISIGG